MLEPEHVLPGETNAAWADDAALYSLYKRVKIWIEIDDVHASDDEYQQIDTGAGRSKLPELRIVSRRGRVDRDGRAVHRGGIVPAR